MTFKNLCCHLHGWTKALESSRFRPPTHQQTRPAMPTSGSSASPANKPRQHPLSFRSMWQRSFIKKVEYRVESFCRLQKPTSFLYGHTEESQEKKQFILAGCAADCEAIPLKILVIFHFGIEFTIVTMSELRIFLHQSLNLDLPHSIL